VPVNAEDDDFLSQMHLLVMEQSHLFEFPMGSRDLLPDSPVHHGPWDPAECAQILGGWLAKGWLSVFVDSDHVAALGESAWWLRTSPANDPKYRDLHPSDAATLLRFPGKWLPGTPDGNVMVGPSDEGAAVPYADWAGEANGALATMQRRVSHFYRRPWGEKRGDEHSDWGTCVYYFWVLDGVVEQQVERYEDGTTLAFDRYHREDEYGFLTSEPLEPGDEWASLRH
jgi:hypothetical protein